jgi:copper chaperone CopZ
MSRSYRVEGMTCAACAAAVTAAIEAVEPAAEVEVDLDDKTVTVRGLEDDGAVAGAINDAGFESCGRV